MANKEILVTAEGLRELEEELSILKSQKRADIAEQIKEARSHGDLSENSEYDEAEYHIVGSTESDPLKGYISDESPVGKGLLGHAVGEIVDIETPGGIQKYKILDISK